ncbi:TetR/AcrR family transcriptional regulator [Kribbella turkmenica]|uniref:TetR/AcrR family transcriptional regulator n=1 Tax=Kribbella turkmenica TaxID=2530375 RepID=A0A4R4WDI4_9ACTN|nr:TetR/AcrR family transcriptional regulator [Kribbella turkmenica]TDD16271.1 TetR/AcrR family transcriptional regulator [Kribbella turkmenica]
MSGGRSDKRRAILDGALTEFGRDGYARASIDAIAAAAGVSTRTIYAHFGNKAGLFESVIQESATRVADTQIAIVERHLGKVVHLEADLEAFGLELTEPMTGFRDHFSLVRHVNADLDHIPPAAIEAWQDAGPRRVVGALADRLRQLADRGLLALGVPAENDPDAAAKLAASHLMLLVQGAVPFHHGVGANREPDRESMVQAGVRVFLRGYLPAPGSGSRRPAAG